MKYIFLDTNIYLDFVLLRNTATPPDGREILKKLLKQKNVKLLIPDIVKIEFDRQLNKEIEQLNELEQLKINDNNWKLLNTVEIRQEKEKILNEINKNLYEGILKLEKLNMESLIKLKEEIAEIFALGQELVCNNDLLIKSYKSLLYGIAPCHVERKISAADSLIIEFLIEYMTKTEFKDDDEIVFITSNYKDFSNIEDTNQIHEDIKKRIDNLNIKFTYGRFFYGTLKKVFSEEIKKLKLEEEVNIADKSEYAWPVPSSNIITAKFGKLDIALSGMENVLHTGIDIAAKYGEHIISVLPGKAIKVGYNTGYGNMIIVEHENNIKSLYAHLSKNNVKLGDVVEKGQVIGSIGNTGNSTGPHLHFEILIDGKRVDPIQYFNI